ncbi:MAG: ABC transporter ATP-binding protein [Lachnospiraceae bacterium]|nr:ABC transporter ATP-binding protein [Lachnospiraceae bacterium]
MKKRTNKNIKLGERDAQGKFKVPYTNYGLLDNLKYIFSNIWKYRKVMVLMYICGALTQSVMRYLWSYIGKFLVDIIEAQSNAAVPDTLPLWYLVAGIAVVELLAIGGNTLISNRVYINMAYVRFRMITEKNDKLLSMNYQMLEQPHILDLHQRAMNAAGGDMQGIGGMMNRSFALAARLVTIAVTATTIVVLDPRLILVLTAAMGINYLSQRWSIRDDKKYFWDATSSTRRKMNYMERSTQDFDYAKDIRLFSLKPWLLKKQRDIFDEYERKYGVSRNVWLRHSFIYSTTSLMSSLVMYYILITQVLHESVSIGNFTLYLGLCSAFSSALSDFYDNFGQMQFASNLVDDFRTFMDLKTEIEEDKLDISVLENQYSFEFKNVSFRYEGAKEDTIKNLNLKFPAGQRLAVVGLNGAGKTTFIKLLLRLYDVTSGEILVNGYNIKQFRKQDYFRLFAPVFQNVELFAFPMAENVSMKEPEATDRERVQNCLIQAGMKEKLDSMEKGMDTEILKVLHEDGVDLSGGERQKLALARALYKDAAVIVLDEPTAALDALAEYELYQNFDRMISSKSAIYISHRLSSTRFCDMIAMFVDGRIVEYGTHEELLAKQGEYANMFEVQAQYYENHGKERADNEEE